MQHDSTDTSPYAVACEVEDLAGVIEAVGGSASVVGHSSGAILSLEGALAGLPVARLAVYEPPYVVGDDRQRPAGLAAEVDAALAAGRPGDVVAAFMAQTVQMPPQAIEGLRRSPVWPALEALAPTIPYDLAICGDQRVTGRLGAVNVPTLAICGRDSPFWARHAVEVVAAHIPGARRQEVAGSHQVTEAALAPVLARFLLAEEPVPH